MVGVMAVMPTSFKRIYAHTVVFSALDPEAGHCQPKPLPETPGHSQASLFWGHCSLLLVPGAHKVFFVPSKTLFLQPHGSSVIKSHWPLKSNYLGILSPLADPQVGKSVVGPSTFLTVFCSLSVVCWRFYGGANGDLLFHVMQEDFHHMPHHPGLLQPEPLSPWQATSDPCLCREHSKADLAQSLVGFLGPGVHKVLFHPSELFCWVWVYSKCNFPLLPFCWGFFFVLGHGISFLVGSNILLSMNVRQQAAILEFLQEKMSSHPSTPPS